jgi:HEPN domain-containing protein
MAKDSLNPQKWIIRAQMDFDSATREAEYFRPPIEVVCSLCQQSAEKILKAYTLAKENTRKQTHTMEDLLNDCERHSPEFSKFKKACSQLTQYITAARYPSDIDLIEYHMRQALKDAGEILDFTKAKLKELGYEYNPLG